MSGNIYDKVNDSVHYSVTCMKELKVIKEHFDNYRLHTKKRADFELWSQAFDLIESKEHLTKEGLHKIIGIRAGINKGLSDEQKASFPSILPVEISNVENITSPDPEWMAGFASLPPSDSPILDWGVGGGVRGLFQS